MALRETLPELKRDFIEKEILTLKRNHSTRSHTASFVASLCVNIPSISFLTRPSLNSGNIAVRANQQMSVFVQANSRSRMSLVVAYISFDLTALMETDNKLWQLMFLFLMTMRNIKKHIETFMETGNRNTNIAPCSFDGYAALRFYFDLLSLLLLLYDYATNGYFIRHYSQSLTCPRERVCFFFCLFFSNIRAIFF